jgi:hypothetical protein
MGKYYVLELYTIIRDELTSSFLCSFLIAEQYASIASRRYCGRGLLEIQILAQMREHNIVKLWMPGKQKENVEEEEEVLAVHGFDDVDKEDDDQNTYPTIYPTIAAITQAQV